MYQYKSDFIFSSLVPKKLEEIEATKEELQLSQKTALEKLSQYQEAKNALELEVHELEAKRDHEQSNSAAAYDDEIERLRNEVVAERDKSATLKVFFPFLLLDFSVLKYLL
jgi:chromosome segregation ATPase